MERKMNKKLLNIARIFLGVFILFLLFWRVGVDKIYDAFSRADLIFVLLSVFAFLLVVFISSVNVYILLSRIKKINFVKFLRFYLLGWVTGQVSPGKIGEFSLAYYMKNENVQSGKIVAVVLLDKLISLIFVGGTALVGFLFFFREKFAFEAILLFFGIVFGVIVFFFSNTGRTFIKKYILRKYSIHFKGFSKALNFFLLKQKKFLFYDFLLTALRMFFVVTMFSLLFIAFGTRVDFLTVFLNVCMIGVITSLPITTGGLGVRESAATFLFGLSGVEASVVLSAYLCNIVINYLFAFLSFFFTKNV